MSAKGRIALRNSGTGRHENPARWKKGAPSKFCEKAADTVLNLKFHSGTSSWGGTRKLPRDFTEQGVAIFSSVLRSRQAVQVNIEIMRVFVRLRQMLQANVDLARELAEIEKKYDAQFKVVFDAIRQLVTPRDRRMSPT